MRSPKQGAYARALAGKMNNNVDFESFARIWLLTWTTYGTWLPGDNRGFVSPKFDGGRTEKRHNVPGMPYDAGREELQRMAAAKMAGAPVWLTKDQAEIIRAQFDETARHRGWAIIRGAVMTNHVHLLVGVAGDPDPSYLMRDFKSYASRALNRRWNQPESGKWWTEQGSKRKVKDQQHLETVIRYVEQQPNALVTWGERNNGERGA